MILTTPNPTASLNPDPNDRAIVAENISIHEAYQFVEDNPHPRLWRNIAEARP